MPPHAPLRSALAALLALAACASAGRPAAGACPDARPVCLAGVDCAYDLARGCQVCVCRSADPAIERRPGPAQARPEDQQLLPQPSR